MEITLTGNASQSWKALLQQGLRLLPPKAATPIANFSWSAAFQHAYHVLETGYTRSWGASLRSISFHTLAALYFHIARSCHA